MKIALLLITNYVLTVENSHLFFDWYISVISLRLDLSVRLSVFVPPYLRLSLSALSLCLPFFQYFWPSLSPAIISKRVKRNRK